MRATRPSLAVIVPVARIERSAWIRSFPPRAARCAATISSTEGDEEEADEGDADKGDDDGGDVDEGDVDEQPVKSAPTRASVQSGRPAAERSLIPASSSAA